MDRNDEVNENDRQAPVHTDYWIVQFQRGGAVVSRTSALRIERALDRRWSGRWIRFTDLFGSRLRVRRDQIVALRESTAPQRRRDRRLDRALERENKADRCEWEDD